MGIERSGLSRRKFIVGLAAATLANIPDKVSTSEKVSKPNEAAGPLGKIAAFVSVFLAADILIITTVLYSLKRYQEVKRFTNKRY